MKIYIAAQYHRKEEMQLVRGVICKAGHCITSTWLDETHNPSTSLHEVDVKERIHTAATDVEDILRADIMLLFSNDPLIPTVRGGKNVEMGIAIGTSTPVYVIGPYENIFHYLPDTHHCADLAEFLKTIGEL